MLRFITPSALLAAVTCQPVPVDDARARVASFYRQRIQQAGIVGSSLTFVKYRRVVHAAFEGYQERETNRRVDEDTIDHWTSITKTLTGVAIMQLRDRGLLSLDDAAVKYVPVEADPLAAGRGDAARRRAISCRSTLTFSSKRVPRHSTRAVDNELHDVIIRELFQPELRR